MLFIGSFFAGQTEATCCWEPGRLVRTACIARLVVFALRAQCGRDVALPASTVALTTK